MDGLLDAANALHARVRGAFGPTGEHALVFAPPDAPLLTGEGHAVLRARKQQLANATTTASGPFERVMLDAAEGVYREIGDGTTQFVIMLHSVLHQIRQDGVGSQRTGQRVRMAHALGTLRHQWGAKILLSEATQARLAIEEPVELKLAKDGAVSISTALQTRINQVLTTALTGVLGHRVVHATVTLVVQWVFAAMQRQHVDPGLEPMRFLYRHLQLYLRQAPRAIVHAIGGSFAASHVVDGDAFVLPKSLIPSQLPSLLGGIKPMRFVCVTASLDLTIGSNPITYDPAATGQGDAIHALDGVRMRVVQFLTELRRTHHVRLIISTEKIEDYIAAACDHLEMACVQYAENEDVEALGSITGVIALTSAVKEIEEDLHIGVCVNGVSVVRHAQRPSLYLRGLRRNAPPETIPAIPQLVVYAPSKSVFKQYYNAMLKSLRVVRCLFSDHSAPPCVRFCRGAGASELAIAKALRLAEQKSCRAGEDTESSLLQAKLVLSTALIESVARLRTNLAQGCGASERARSSRQSDRVLLDEMSRMDCAEESKPRGYVLSINHSISTKLGKIQIPTLVEGDPQVYNVIHPSQRVETIVYTVLQTAEMLLRVDAVVHIKRNPDLQRTGLHEASEGDG